MMEKGIQTRVVLSSAGARAVLAPAVLFTCSRPRFHSHQDKEGPALPSGVTPPVVLGKLEPWWSRLAASQTGHLHGAAIEKTAGLASCPEFSTVESTPNSALHGFF